MNCTKTIVKRVVLVSVLLILSAALWAGVQLHKVLAGSQTHRPGDTTPAGATSLRQEITDLTQIVGDPYQGFPGQDKVVILGMGIDDNWTDSDEVYTAAARTDTLFLLTLYLTDHRATMVSIPRDTYTHIAGTGYSTKINSAYSTGGPARAIATVAELTGVKADHYMVINIDATKKMVDALGGVDVNVEHEMHYHDKWGHLNIDLQPGQQHLTGAEAVGFARYRHPDAGAKASPEDGDERRMYRQHILLRAMVGKAKSFINISQIGTLANVGMTQIHSDLTRAQLLDLAQIYRGIQPDQIQTASLPGEDFAGPGGASDYRLYPEQSKAYIDWLVRGDATAARRLVPIVIKNNTSVEGLAAHAADFLRSQGYTDVRVLGIARTRPRLRTASTTTATKPDASVTQILDTGVPDSAANAALKTLLELPNAADQRIPNKPNHMGWTAPSEVTISLGDDYAGVIGVTDNKIPASATATTDRPSDNAGPSTDPSVSVPVTNEQSRTGQQ